jgi:hypothetical protein
MQSRMEKYNNQGVFTSRVEKNKSLYEEVKNSSITDFNVDENTTVLDNNSSRIDAGNLRNLLDSDYTDNTPKRRSIIIENNMDEPEPIHDTKEYDINAILKKAKEGKDINYNKERLKSVRQTQYEILNNLDLTKTEEPDAYHKKKKADEENLMELINTITALELKNREAKKDDEVSQALDLFDDLNEGAEEEIQPEELKEKIVEKKVEEQPKKVVKETIKEEPIQKVQKESEKQETHDEHVTKTLSKLNIDMDSYDEFGDVVKGDKSTFILKVMIFLVIILLIIGTIFIVNNMLNLGLFD